MIIETLEIYHVRLPLRIRFAQANQNTVHSDSVVVRLKTQLGTSGYGEACPRLYVTGEDAASVKRQLDRWRAVLLSTPFTTLSDIEEWTRRQLEQEAGPAAVCAVELALLDAWSREYQRDLRTELGVLHNSSDVRYSGVLPHGAWAQLAPIITKFEFGSWKFKAYATPTENRRRILDVQSLWGEATPLRLDANAGWTTATVRTQIETALELGVSSIEQPLPVGQAAETAALVREYGDRTRIMADESLCTLADAQRLIDQYACNHFSIKLSKNGGLFNSLRIYGLARKNGIPCQLSAHYGETSILTAAGHLFALLVPELTALEGALGTFLLEKDIVEAPLMVDRRGYLNRPNPRFLGWPVSVRSEFTAKFPKKT